MERLAGATRLEHPGELAGALSLLFEGAIVTAYVEGDRSAGHKARRAAEKLMLAHRPKASKRGARARGFSDDG